MGGYTYPKAVVFDLDYTVWPCWCDTHITPPLRSTSKNRVTDAYKFNLALYEDVSSIITELVQNDVIIIGASRTATPRIAQELLSLLHIGDKPAIKYFDSLQWGQGSKIKHITKAAKQLQLEDDLKDGQFILFDDEMRNRDVESIRCHFAYVPDEERGLTRQIFEEELTKWTNSRRKQ
ncbi:magnesium-dependent phosphatase-1 [Suhomyces tanzawaensis NRRL Y-17324]|uniref:Magnesium-dependent phosphatase-1 n=1 Tax=Suhomyces tanzawaensis NRRL Y-17324 TaxID=984487 RepID=A0A1E4SHR8_9ASCO|nr:magnesium-dependent phosphatase-1 [Suhomyces tanzawaensis NRRL Y-17324]ODV79043.1 magnesium-dependent phosphatase-1 [Suhomyces tanzawaensis NRRL Y-17324]